MKLELNKPFQCRVDTESGTVLLHSEGQDVEIAFKDLDAAWEFASNALDAWRCVVDRTLREMDDRVLVDALMNRTEAP